MGTRKNNQICITPYNTACLQYYTVYLKKFIKENQWIGSTSRIMFELGAQSFRKFLDKANKLYNKNFSLRQRRVIISGRGVIYEKGSQLSDTVLL